MSLFESGESNGSVSLKSLFDGETFEPQSNNIDLQRIAYLTCRGGWPQATLLEGDIALDQAFGYIDDVTERDIQRVDGVKRSAERARLLLRSYARNISQQVSYGTIKADMLSNDANTLDEDTVADYIKALKKLFVIEDLEAWNPNIRSKSAIRTSDTRHFVDPSIGTAALGLGPNDLINDLDSFGLIFEDMAESADKHGLMTDIFSIKNEGTHFRMGSDILADTHRDILFFFTRTRIDDKKVFHVSVILLELDVGQRHIPPKKLR